MAKLYDCNVNAQKKSLWLAPSRGVEETIVLEYDFSEMGGAVGAYLIGNLPKNCIVNEVTALPVVAMTGTGDVDTLGTTINTGAEFVADIAAVTVGTLTAGVPKIDTPSTWVKCSADTPVYFNIATGAATAGHVYFIVRYLNVPVA
jgi:hypothetical protein